VNRRHGIEKVLIDDIVVRNRWRKPTAAQIEAMRKSLQENGLLTPIAVWLVNDDGTDSEAVRPVPVLVYGATRLAAAKLESWSEIDAQILDGSEVDFEKAELVENLHRAELTKLQRDRQIVRYVELCGGGERILRGARAKMGRGRPQGGVRAAARELKLAESTARDAMKTAKITEPAAAAITDLGLANSPNAYRAIAAEPTTEAQIAKAREIATHKEQDTDRAAGRLPANTGTTALVAAWDIACPAVQQEFLRLIGHSDCEGRSRAARSLRLSAKPNGSPKGVAEVRSSLPPSEQLVLGLEARHVTGRRE
jgi:ParB-like chromosome segregation protein Spo0J